MPSLRLRLFAPLPGLSSTARVRPLGAGAELRGGELLALLGAGALAGTLTALVDLDLGIPGHHIVLTMFPIALGFALVPRRAAGTLMGAAGVTTLAGLGAAGVHLPGPGAIAGLALAGPMLDLALRWGGGGWRLYAAFLTAGAGTNVLAFVARATTKYFGLGGMGGGRQFVSWLPLAVWTYALAGILAGLVSAAAWFHFRARE